MSAVRTGGWPCQRLQVREQFVGIVGQGFQFFTCDRDGSGVVRGIDIDSRRRVGDLNLHLLHFDGHGNVEAQRLRGDGYVVVFVESESLSNDVQRVLAGSQTLELIKTLSVGLRLDGRRGSGCRRENYVGAGNGGSGRVGYLPAQNA